MFLTGRETTELVISDKREEAALKDTDDATVSRCLWVQTQSGQQQFSHQHQQEGKKIEIKCKT